MTSLSPADLDRAARILFGDEWVRPLAAAVGVNHRSIERMRSGKNTIDDWVSQELLGLIASRIEKLERARDIVDASRPSLEAIDIETAEDALAECAAIEALARSDADGDKVAARLRALRAALETVFSE